MGLPDVLLKLYIALFGLVIGSYLNVLIYRLPQRISTVLPRSRCPRCQAPIRAWDNLPVISFLFLRGRCRHCGLPISWRYPFVEATTAVCFVSCFERFASWQDLLVGAVFCAAMIVLAMIDLEHYLLPDVITKTGLVAALVLQTALLRAPVRHQLSWTTPTDAWIGAVLGGVVLYALAWAWYRFKGVHGMGLGDVKMLAMIGAFLGWQGTLVTLFLASLSGSLVGAGLMLSGRLNLQSRLPFGVFLAGAAVISLFFGNDLLATYLGFSGL